jgi:phosphoribosylaminoimidazolecarboxamide formyltransferase / IMP cyclohydrolase
MSINRVSKIDNRVKVRSILASVSDKSGLDDFLPRLLTINPELTIYSTGGTFARIKDILGDAADGRLIAVSDYTGQPETQGGLVKTLDFKIYLGLLTETYNKDHTKDIQRTGANYIDLVVVNLYPFSQTIAQPDVTPEQARGNIDIGGPCMVRAAAKNFIRTAPIVNPGDYPAIAEELENNDGHLSLDTRFLLARKAFEHTATYDRAIADFLKTTPPEKIRNCYTFQD